MEPLIWNGTYSITHELGRGTTGTVYEAVDLRLKRPVALKMLSLLSSKEPRATAEQFLTESRTLAHWEPVANIPELYEVAEFQGQLYYAREFIAGSTLVDQVEERSIGFSDGLRAIAIVARTAGWVHGRGFVHQNLTPDNVLIAPDGVPKLIGFGRVALLENSELIPGGSRGVSPTIDVQMLQAVLKWFFAEMGRPLPSTLNRRHEPFPTAVALANAIEESL